MPERQAGAAGGRQRSSPTGGAAKGIPLKTVTASARVPAATGAPRNVPLAVSTASALPPAGEGQAGCCATGDAWLSAANASVPAGLARGPAVAATSTPIITSTRRNL